MIKYIKPLPVSEEMLGAYLEGNLSKYESLKIEEMMQSNVFFKEFVDEVSSLGEGVGLADGDDFVYEGYPNFAEEFRLPEIPELDSCIFDDADFVFREQVDYNSISDDDANIMMEAWSNMVLEANFVNMDEGIVPHLNEALDNLSISSTDDSGDDYHAIICRQEHELEDYVRNLDVDYPEEGYEVYESD